MLCECDRDIKALRSEAIGECKEGIDGFVGLCVSHIECDVKPQDSVWSNQSVSTKACISKVRLDSHKLSDELAKRGIVR